MIHCGRLTPRPGCDECRFEWNDNAICNFNPTSAIRLKRSSYKDQLYAKGEVPSTTPHQTSTAIPWTPASLSAFKDIVKALILERGKNP